MSEAIVPPSLRQGKSVGPVAACILALLVGFLVLIIYYWRVKRSRLEDNAQVVFFNRNWAA